MGRIEHHRRAALRRLEDLEGGVEFCLGGAAHRDRVTFSGASLVPYISMWARLCQDKTCGSPHIYRQCGLWVLDSQDPPPFHDPAVPQKILLAEDDNDMRRFLVKALENAGYEVIDYDNGMSAYRRLREEPFELLLTDIVMPEMDGIELARRAAELDPDIKIMFITGFAAVALNADSKAPKDAKVLSKPFHLRDLVNEVQKMLAA